MQNSDPELVIDADVEGLRAQIREDREVRHSAVEVEAKIISTKLPMGIDEMTGFANRICRKEIGK
jgi:hypothetical protein